MCSTADGRAGVLFAVCCRLHPPRARRYSDYQDYVRHSLNSLGGVSAVTRRGVDPLPHLNSERDWRRHERGLYRESTALNEDIFMYVAFRRVGVHGGRRCWHPHHDVPGMGIMSRRYALVLKKSINYKSELWSEKAVADLEEGCVVELLLQPRCLGGCAPALCVCSLLLALLFHGWLSLGSHVCVTRA